MIIKTLKSYDNKGDLFPVWKEILNIDIKINVSRKML